MLVFALTAGSDAKQPYRSGSAAEVKQKLAARLHQRLLRAHWIACVPSGRRYHDAAVVRCNVNFGDPHIEAYCLVLRNGKLYSNHDDPAVPCQRDNAAPPATIVSS